MLVGRIDREAWAREIRDLMVRFDPGPKGDGNKSAFAARVGRTRQTIIRWLAQETDISRESVGQVLDRLGLSQTEQSALLHRIGYFTTSAPATLPQPPAIPDPYQDEVIQEILADERWNEVQRAELVQQQLDRMEADLQRRREEYVRLLRMYSDGQQAS